MAFICFAGIANSGERLLQFDSESHSFNCHTNHFNRRFNSRFVWVREHSGGRKRGMNEILLLIRKS
jgi:hypothetical protein